MPGVCWGEGQSRCGIVDAAGTGCRRQQVLVVGALSGKASGFVWDRPTPGVI